jgi:hypothetical protein
VWRTNLAIINTISLSNNLLEEDYEHDVNEGKEERHPENGQ